MGLQRPERWRVSSTRRLITCSEINLLLLHFALVQPCYMTPILPSRTHSRFRRLIQFHFVAGLCDARLRALLVNCNLNGVWKEVELLLELIMMSSNGIMSRQKSQNGRKGMRSLHEARCYPRSLCVINFDSILRFIVIKRASRLSEHAQSTVDTSND